MNQIPEVNVTIEKTNIGAKIVRRRSDGTVISEEPFPQKK